jgi:epoxyqueuosine reductase
MEILLHICCAPCTIYPLEVLRRQRHHVSGLYYNPNIHPYSEYARRMEALETYARHVELNVIWTKEYNMEEFLQSIAFREKERCYHCYYERLRRTVMVAKRDGFDAFTTTLFYSKYQDHSLIRTVAENLAKEYQVDLLYGDYRKGWSEATRRSREYGMYRQRYCGCIYSEKERFYADSGIYSNSHNAIEKSIPPFQALDCVEEHKFKNRE